ncbi:MAG: acetoacetate decarboxylase family protein [Chloroflexota bacterium]
MTEQVPAPWTLTGNGLMLLYRFPREFVLENGFVPSERRDSFVGGIGGVMLVDYQTSNVGPYRELLFIPGQFQIGGKRYYAITKIYVSTMISVENGRTNWAIPKELADFDIQNDDHTFAATQEGKSILNLSIKSRRLSLPVNTAWSPLKLLLGQLQNGSLYITAPAAKGKIQLANILDVRANPALFPDIGQFPPLAAVGVRDFTMTFPVAHVQPFAQSLGAPTHEHP